MATSKNCVFWSLRSGRSIKDGLVRLEKDALYCLLAILTGSGGTLNVYFDHSLETLGEEEEVEQPMHETVNDEHSGHEEELAKSMHIEETSEEKDGDTCSSSSVSEFDNNFNEPE